MSGYPFVDIAVLDGVRRAFAAGDALVIAAPALDAVIWANGAGLELFGLGSLDEALGGSAALDEIQRRQMAAALPADDGERMLHMRFVQAPQTILLPVHLRSITLPDGAPAILIRIPAHALQSRLVTLDTLDAIEAAGSHAALLRTGARFVARSARFADVTVDPDDLARMIADAAAEGDRLIKRPMRTSKGLLPAALARLTDEDGLHLLVVLDPDEADGAAQDGGPAGASDGGPSHALPPLLPDGDETLGAGEETPGAGEETLGAGEERDRTDTDAGADAAPLAEPVAAPVRFAWKCDADGRIIDVSGRLVEALGMAASDLIGHDFATVAERHGVRGIEALLSALDRRDTWSGVELLWPLATGGDGAPQAVPLELAGLPLYGRERAFTGFRGFGVARFDAARALPAMPEPAADSAPASAADAADSVIRPFGRRIGAAQETVARDRIAGAGSIPDGSIPQAGDPGAQLQTGSVQKGSVQAGLAPDEADAFAEIGARLRAEAGRPAAAASEAAEGEPDPDGQASDAASDASGDASDDASGDAAPAGADRQGQAHLVAKLPLPVLIYSAEGLLFANEAFLALSGHDGIEALAAAGGLEALFSGGDISADDADARGMRLNRADGTSVDINAHLQSVPWNGGKALMLAIAERRAPRQAEPAPAPEDSAPERGEALRQIEELTAILDTATDGVVVLEADGRIRSLNNAAQALFGYEPDEVAGRHFNTLLAIESHRAARDYLSALNDNGVASVLNDGREMIGREREGRFVPLFVTIGRLAASDGFCAVIRDMTTFKRAEEELTAARRDAEHASSNKSEFVARISHEIRTPLNAIIGFSELMMQERFGPLGNERYRNYAADIHASGSLVLQLVNDLLDISRIEAGEQTLDFRAIDLNGVVGDAMALLQPQANRERVLLRTSLAEALPQLVADERSIKQILLNLVSNAVRFTDAGGQVIVSTAHESDGTITLRVRDTGIGMNDNELAKAMKPYRQVGNRPSSESAGTGLGLPLARALAESNKAEFRIRSTPGHGTVIEIAFPASRVLAG